MKKIIIALIVLGIGLAACENGGVNSKTRALITEPTLTEMEINAWPMSQEPTLALQIPYQYAYADPFYGEYAWVWKSTTMSIKSTEVDVNLYCIINLQGEVVLSMDTWDKMPASLISSGVHNELCLVVDTENPRLNVYKYINLKGEVIYSWSEKTNRQGYDAPERREQTEADRDEMMLRMFKGTKYYPLAEQCVRSRRAHAERE